MGFIEVVCEQFEVDKFNWACKFVHHQVLVTQVEPVYLVSAKY